MRFRGASRYNEHGIPYGIGLDGRGALHRISMYACIQVRKESKGDCTRLINTRINKSKTGICAPADAANYNIHYTEVVVAVSLQSPTISLDYSNKELSHIL